jgi:GDP-4-dehydro-6-deoxy-D-mannose reductase
VSSPLRRAEVRVLVTGGGGFAGRHLTEHLTALGHDVVAPSHAELELRDAEAVRRAVAEAAPGSVFHLAALASVARSWKEPRETLVGNLEMTVNLLEAVRAEAPDARVVHASSGEVYGRPSRLPLDEEAPLRPQNPYATSKAACDLLAGQYADAYELQVTRTRAFNHAGPGQPDDFVVGTLTRQVAEAEARGDAEAVLRTGNPDARRDFTDVRDVVRAYVVAADLVPDVYNVCSGRTASVRDLVELLRGLARVPLRHELDPARVRPHEVPEVRGSAELLRSAGGWAPEIPLERTLADALDYWRAAA